MGYVGTDSRNEIDLCDEWGITPEQVADMKQEDVQKDLDEELWNSACEKVEAYAEPDESKN
jgi:hypothetical protein